MVENDRPELGWDDRYPLLESALREHALFAELTRRLQSVAVHLRPRVRDLVMLIPDSLSELWREAMNGGGCSSAPLAAMALSNSSLPALGPSALCFG